MKKEIWKDIEGYEGLYQVSNYGNVKSLSRKESRILKHYTTGGGYRKVKLSKNNLTQQIQVHRLVAQYFIPNPENKTDVNHLDENKTNNLVSNLEWCTHKENIRYYFRNKRLFNVIDVKSNIIIAEFQYFIDAAEFCNIASSSVLHVLKGRTKTAGKKKFTFKYIDQ